MGIRFVALPHAEWISPRESTQNPLRAGDVRGELCHHAIAPFSGSDPAADDRPKLKVEIDQGAVDHQYGLPSGQFDDLDDFGEAVLVGGAG